MKTKIEPEQVPREYYDIVASLSERLEESGVPQSYIDRALDKVEKAIVQALDHAEEEDDEPDDEPDSEDEDNDETRPG